MSCDPWGAGLGCRAGEPGWGAGLGCRAGVPGWGAGLGSRAGVPGWGAGLGLRPWYPLDASSAPPPPWLVSARLRIGNYQQRVPPREGPDSEDLFRTRGGGVFSVVLRPLSHFIGGVVVVVVCVDTEGVSLPNSQRRNRLGQRWCSGPQGGRAA
eukprot:gene14537-biopygen20109